MAKAPETVDALMAGLDHPLKAEIEAVRAIILKTKGVDEGVKWNAPSFRTAGDWFATVNLRAKDGVQLVFHRGAKVKANVEMEIPDPKGLVKWLDKNRALVTLGSGAAFKANGKALAAIVKAWMAYV
jgi:hypothetical protein